MYEIVTSSNALNSAISVEDQLEEIVQIYRSGNTRLAETLCESMVIYDPSIAPVWHMLGLLRNDSEDVKAAVRLIRHSIDLDPTNARYHFNLGVIFEKNGERLKAQELYRHALQLDPELKRLMKEENEFLVDQN